MTADLVDFSTGLTDPASFPTEELATAAVEAIRGMGPDFVHYPGSLGHAGLRRILAARESEREGIEVDPDLVAITCGSMQAVTLVGRVLIERPGDIILCEELTYSGTLAAYRALGARLEGVPVDREGLRVDELERRLETLHGAGTPPRFLYTLPTYHNPTAAVMPRRRRERLLEIARRFELTVLEDNCYGDVRFGDEAPPSLFALDGGERVVYVGSLSKIFAAGLRLGYLHARPHLFEPIVEQRFDCGPSLLSAGIVAAYLDGRLWRHVESHNRVLSRKREALLQALDTHLADRCRWVAPAGGLFLWLRLPPKTDLDRLEERSAERGVAYVRGRDFHVQGVDVPAIRLAFGYPNPEEIRRGVGLLADCIRESGPRARAVSRCSARAEGAGARDPRRALRATRDR